MTYQKQATMNTLELTTQEKSIWNANYKLAKETLKMSEADAVATADRKVISFRKLRNTKGIIKR